jgi:asparagine synthase (glutamine-hydrolysing)
MGLRPFVYYFDGKTFIWASELRALFEFSDVTRKTNEGMAGEYLSARIRSLTETLYQGVMRLAPAHCLSVDAAGVRFRRYWDFDPSKRVLYRTDDQYAGHFYDLFREAVRCRMRSLGPVASELSGGLDSSSVVAMAQELSLDGRGACAGFQTFSWVFPGRECDESFYVNEVVSKWNLVSRALTPEPLPVEAFIELTDRYLDFPCYPNAQALDSLRSLAVANGCRVVLTGQGGDEWLTGMLDGLREFARAYLRNCMWPRAPRIAQRLVRRFLNRPETPRWVDTRFAQRIDLGARLRQKTHVPQSASFAQREMYSALTNGFNVHAQEVGERNSTWLGLELRHPLCDRRIVEFGLAIPEGQRRRRETDKFILRNAMKEALPAPVLNREDKAEFSHLFIEQMKAMGGAKLFDSMEIATGSPVWINRAEVRSMYSQMERFSRMIWGVEIWRRATIGTVPLA